VSRSSSEASHRTDSEQRDEQKNSRALRREVHRLFNQEHQKKSQISRRLGVSRSFVNDWATAAESDLEQDARGWIKGRARRYPEDLSKRIAALHQKLQNDPEEFFTGATAIRQLYLSTYPDDPLPSLRLIGQRLKQLNLSSPRARGRNKGGAAYLCYPERTIYTTLSQRLLEVDFIGPRYLSGSNKPLHFLGLSFKQQPRLRLYQRVEAQSADALISTCEWFFDNIETPGLLKVDNCSASIGSASAEATVSRFVEFLWHRGVTPIFSVPRRPFTQASIEGNNSVFSSKFWIPRTFTDIKDIDRQLNWFNDASMRYLQYHTPPLQPKSHEFEPQIYLLRQVHSNDELNDAAIDLLNRRIVLHQQYLNLFVLAAWTPLDSLMNIYLENQDHEPVCIHSCDFPINPNARLSINHWK